MEGQDYLNWNNLQILSLIKNTHKPEEKSLFPNMH